MTTWESLALGEPTHDFEPTPPDAVSYRPDSIADGWSTEHFTVRVASVRGYAHRFRGVPRQDDAAVTVHRPSGGIVLAVADGVSAAPRSHIGATAACRSAISTILDALNAGARVDWQQVVQYAAWQLVEQAKLTLGLSQVDPARAQLELATTLVAGLVMPTPSGPEVTLVQVGDTSAWTLRGGVFRRLFDAGRPGPVSTSEVTALPQAPHVTPHTGILADDELLLVGTDGFGDPLGDGTGVVAEHFARRLPRAAPPLRFAHDLDFSRETFDDDRTLLTVCALRTG